MTLRSASSSSAIIRGRNHQSRSPSKTRATYSFIDHPRAEAACLTQSVSRNERRKETIPFSSVSGSLDIGDLQLGTAHCITNGNTSQVAVHRDSMWNDEVTLESLALSGLDRCVEQVLSRPQHEGAREDRFEAAGGEDAAHHA